MRGPPTSGNGAVPLGTLFEPLHVLYQEAETRAASSPSPTKRERQITSLAPPKRSAQQAAKSLDEVTLELERAKTDQIDNPEWQPSRLHFIVDPSLSEKGHERVCMQAQNDETRTSKLRAWEDAKRWTFVMENLTWAKEKETQGLMGSDKLIEVLKL